MAVCAAQGCFNSDAENCETSLMEGVTFHPFPRNPVLRARWVNQMNDESFEPNAQSVLCSLHFIKEYFVTDANGVQYLKPDAIPTEFEYECYTGEEPPIACCAYRCRNNSNSGPPITLHQFPIDQPDLCDQWLLAMNIAQVEADKAVLCSEHFDDSCFIIGDDGERHMMANAVPSIFVFPDPSEAAEDGDDTSIPDENKNAIITNTGDVKRETEIPEEILPLVQKHDELVRSLLEEEQRLLQIRLKRLKLQLKKKDLELLMRVVLHGGKIDKDNYNRLKPLITEVDETIQQIVTDCLAPCIAAEYSIIDDSQ